MVFDVIFILRVNYRKMKFKKINLKVYFAITVGFFLFTSFSYKYQSLENNSREILLGVLESISKIKTMRYHLLCNERINGKIQQTESKVKLQISPRKLYLSLKGPELLWLEGQNDGDALINPGAFPYINLNLDPFGTFMRKGQHHTIHEMGLKYLSLILNAAIKRAGDSFEKNFVVVGEEKYYGRDCYKLSIAFPDFVWKSYTVKKGEDLISIARKLFVSEYMILERNPKLSWYDDVKEGQIIQVPDAYAKLTVLLIDKKFLLPVKNEIFDDKGLFEAYEFYDLDVNLPIAAEEFTENYKDYNF